MSSLIFYTDKDQILVATDTLGVSNGGKPFMFSSKSMYIPHIKTIIAGTGVGGFSNEWAMYVTSRMVVKGLDNLDYHTQDGLIRLWEDYKVRQSLPESYTSTVYQLGFSEDTNEVLVFAYRSTNNFASESLGYGTAVKPECKVPEGDLLKLIPSMMQEQREIQSKETPENRIYIGGEIYAQHLTVNGCNIFKIGEFPDFKKQEQEVFANFSENEC
ncbi:hypothetical protein [Psychrobium sp. 1_MG-2023]|uniref:hypothetical protein n=1 Tax=Psychrobium sp. 1_MG-2023 TaxID=3062624 RepID=UPI002736F447|nr:hypothetical protein [Psychrobium sp. 1_MG-2023]MDP2562981.1 hypothetical protein [Psychrobium sp. 1_MG-2023]